MKALGARPRVAYEPLAYEPLRAANRATFGRDAIPNYAIAEAGYLVSFGADFLETWLSPTSGHAADFAKMHAFRDGRAGTFVHVEPRLSMTAANADEWLRNAPGTEGVLALAMLKVIVDEGLVAPGVDARALVAAVQGVDVAAAASRSECPPRRSSTWPTTSPPPRRAGPRRRRGGVRAPTPPRRQVAINLLNVALGAVGKRVRFGADSALRQGEPVRGHAGAHPGDGEGRGRGADPRRRQPRLHHARQGRLRGGARPRSRWW